MDECEHGGDPVTCSVCRRAAGKDASLAVEVSYGQPFTAKFAGFCSSCELGIRQGDSIRFKTINDESQVIHEECE